MIVMDGQFEQLRDDLASIQISINTISNDEHVPGIEKHVRTIKERTCLVYNVLLLKKSPINS
jgi:hypothetical protein